MERSQPSFQKKPILQSARGLESLRPTHVPTVSQLIDASGAQFLANRKTVVDQEDLCMASQSVGQKLLECLRQHRPLLNSLVARLSAFRSSAPGTSRGDAAGPTAPSRPSFVPASPSGAA